MTALAPIPRRQVDFDFDPAQVPRDWCAGDPFLSTHLDALSLLFPEGERFFVDSVKQVRERVTSAELNEQIDGFIGQEAMHGKAHRAFNAMLASRGYAAAPRLERGLRRLLGFGRKRLPQRAQLAVTCALEHFTAMMAEMLLGDEQVQLDMDPSVRGLWVWHALEESEHKAVAFDVYRAIGGGYVVRTSVMLMTTALFVAETAWVHGHFLAQRGILLRPWRWLRGLWHLYGRPGHFRRLIPAYLAYFRPGFHPDDRDTGALLAAWRERLFGDGGELRDRLRGPRAEVAA